jgi:hypothetical protein
MPGVLDDIADFLAGSKALKKAAGTDTPKTKDCPTCGGSGSVGISQADIAKDAQKQADRAQAERAKAKQTPAPKAPPKKTSSLGDMMMGDA